MDANWLLISQVALGVAGALLVAVALVYLVRIDCPYCGETISRRARKCPHCGSDL